MQNRPPLGKRITPRKFLCAGRTVLVHLDPVRTSEGLISVDIEWRPSPPERLQPVDFETFNRCKAQAVQSLADELEAIHAE